MIGILDPKGKNNNPLTDLPYSEKYKELAKKWCEFPAYKNAEKTIDIIRKHQVILISSGTGSGKTVLIPKFVLHAFDYNKDKKIAITLPKQVIAKSAAEFAALTLDVQIGKEVGYQYKGSEKNSKSNKTQLLYATDGTIVSRLLNNIELPDFDAVIIDEAHERKIQIDFLMFLLKETLIKRPDFKLIIMSATINENIFISYFSTFKFKYLHIGGETNYPIKSIYLDKEISVDDYKKYGVELIKKLLREHKDGGDILFFVASINETIEICEILRNHDKLLFCVEMYAGMDKHKQELAQDIDKYKELGKNRKLVVSTNVAESSLTVDGIKFVIDSGYELLSSYDPEKYAKMLLKDFITKAQVKQRMGRTGRTGPGTCYHLYTKKQYEDMKEYPEPNIRTSEITTECLKLLDIPNVQTTENLLIVLSKFIEPPRENYLRMTLKKFIGYGLVHDGKINDLGKLIVELQLDIEMGLTLFASYQFNCMKEVAIILSMIDACKGSLNDIFSLPVLIDSDTSNMENLRRKFKESKKSFSNKYGDHLAMLKIINKYGDYKKNRDKLSDWAYKHFIKLNTLDKSVKNFRKIYYFGKDVLTKIKKIEIQDMMSFKIEHRILASFIFGYRMNIAYRKVDKKDNVYYKTDHIERVGLNKSSFLNENDGKSNVLYNTVLGTKDKYELSIVSSITNDSIKLCQKLTEK